MMSSIKIEQEILESIEMGNGRLMPERVICADVRRALGEKITDEEVLENIMTLRDLEQIEADKDRDLGKRWRLTAEGKLRVRKF